MSEMDEKKLAAIHRSIEDIEQRMKRTQNDLFKDSLLCDMALRLSSLYPAETQTLVKRVLLTYNGYSQEVIEQETDSNRQNGLKKHPFN